MINEPITHDTPYPVEKSAGPDNAYYLRHCAAIERGPSYAACLARLHDIDTGHVNERTSQCEKAVREKRCVAIGLREQEQLAGKALFYFPRLNKPFLPVKVAGDFGVLITNHTDPALIPKSAHGPAPVKKPAAPAKTLDEHLTHATTIGASEALSAALAGAANEPATSAPTTASKPAPAVVPAPVVKSANEPASAVPVGGYKVGEAAVIVSPAKPARPPMLPGETPLQYARRLAATNQPKEEA
jgi:hypothetical protein